MLPEAEFKSVYATGENEPSEFFLEALMNSISLDFGLGFFSSSGFRALSIGFAFFIKRGGKMRMTINNIVSEEDKAALLEGQSKAPSHFFEERVINDIIKLKDTLSRKDIHFFKCLSWLVSTKKLELKATVPKANNIGMVHQKFGLFTDEQNNTVVFNGSVNFSETAILHNVEAIWCDFSWNRSSIGSNRIEYFKDLFSKTWSGKSDVVEIIPIERVKTKISELFPTESLEDLLNEELDLLRSEGKLFSDRLVKSFRMTMGRNGSSPGEEGSFNEPKLPPLRRYQEQAVQSWVQSNCQGLFEMATGTGKTITALTCAKHLLVTEGYINLIILVPTLDLASQWMDEIRKYLIADVLLANSENANWYNEALAAIHHGKTQRSYCIITTYASFLTDRFQSLMSKVSSRAVLIADEVHNFGTKNHIAKYPMHIQRRLGLSATPNRYFDDEGTALVLGYFNSKAKPTFSFSMGDAIAEGYLCEYYYYPIIVTLTEEELFEYKAISKKLQPFYNRASGFSDSPIVAALLLKRKRIIHQAANKFNAFRKILTSITKVNPASKYVLVYVPEGNDQKIDEEDRKLINAYSKIIVQEFGLSQHQFIGLTANREYILREFSKGNISVLTAMKCLDEGVDVKRAEIAIFCASTGNPRQFIQRRGRILRVHPDKKFAVIHDMIVVPAVTNQYFEDSLAMERSILQGELRRVQEFAGLSLNHYQALQVLEGVAQEFDLDIFSKESR